MTAAPAQSGFPALEKYELIEEIGHGGMATVYRAIDPRLGREVAVKVIHKHLRENKEVATRFVAEARAAAKLRHPGIVEVFDVSNEDDSERYLVVELLRGTTLRKVLVDHRDMPAEIGACIVLELCEALDHAHAGAVIHRDVKPENVLVELPANRAACSVPEAARSTPVLAGSSPPSEPKTSSKRGARSRESADPGVVIKLTDFGIAKILDAQGVTSTGQVLGSPAHMAPEQIEGGEVDARTDVFALGVLMYECLVGHLPFEGKNPAQVLRRVLDGTYAPADRERATVGGRWSKIVARALARDAEHRTHRPSELGDEIHAELEVLGITDPKAEISAYFADCAGYPEALTQRLLPRLLARGEAARKAKDIPGAADDFNRALAFAPNDLAILKRITSLTSSASRRLLLKRVASIAAGSAALGLLAFGVARALRAAPPPETEGARPPAIEVVPPVPTEARASGDPEGVTSAAASASAKRRVPMGSNIAWSASPAPSGSAAAGPAGTRRVRFAISPGGATLTVNGQKVADPFSTTFNLKPGSSAALSLTMPDSKCCDAFEGSKSVAVLGPDESPETLLIIPVAMKIREATVTVKGGPANATVTCSGNGFSFNGLVPFTKSVQPNAPVSTVRCTFQVSETENRSGSFKLNAGDSNTIPWPQ